MKIEEYEFGRIKVDGKNYSSDVIIYPEKLEDSWWRKEGHFLQLEDVLSIVQANPKLVVIGTGYYGRMDISEEVKTELKSRGIELIAANSPEAVKLFNQSSEPKKIGAFHLTC